MDDLTRYYTENKALRAEVAALNAALKVAQDEAAWLLAERDKDGAMIEAISAERDALLKVVAAADAMLENMHEWPAGLYAYNTARAKLKGPTK